MRPLEIWLLLANVLAFVVRIVSPLGLLRYSALAALLLAIAQMGAEGPRWQLVPAYVLTGLVLLAWVRQRPTPANRGVVKQIGENLRFSPARV